MIWRKQSIVSKAAQRDAAIDIKRYTEQRHADLAIADGASNPAHTWWDLDNPAHRAELLGPDAVATDAYRDALLLVTTAGDA